MWWMCRCRSCSGVTGAVRWWMLLVPNVAKCQQKPASYSRLAIIFKSIGMKSLIIEFTLTSFAVRVFQTLRLMYQHYLCFCLLTSVDIPLLIWALTQTQDAMYVFSIRAKYSHILKYVGKRETFSFAGKKKKNYFKSEIKFSFISILENRDRILVVCVFVCLFAVH